MSEQTNHLQLWESVQKTDPDFAKKFKRPGGFSGTAVNGLYLQREATRVFGPKGKGWGVDVIEQRFEHGHGETIIHVVLIHLWYKQDDQVCMVPAFGQTTFVGVNRNGVYTDEEAPKKSLTDATSKALSELGFSADIWLGLWDDNKYVAERQAEQTTKKARDQAAANGIDADLLIGRLEKAAHMSTDMYASVWKGLTVAERAAIGKEKHEEFKAIARDPGGDK